MTDPVIVPESTKEWALEEDHRIYSDIKLARLHQNVETPLDERIELATWPETLAYLSTASMDARYATRELKEAYQYSFREYLGRWTSLDPDEQPEPLDQDPELNEYQFEKLNTLRFAIKKDRDKKFVESRYDDLDIQSIPKSFWLTPHEQRQESSSRDEYSQSALDDFR